MNTNNYFTHPNQAFAYNQVNFVDNDAIWAPVAPTQNMNHNYEGQLTYHTYGHMAHQPVTLPTVPSSCLPSQPNCSHPVMPFNQTFDEFPFLYASASQPQYPSSSSSIGVNTYMTPGGFSVPAQYDSLFDGASAAGSEDGKMLREKKFKCAVCSKMFTHRSRAEACAAKDKGERPFACDGKCGTPDCDKEYLSKRLLQDHCQPSDSRKAACPSCGCIYLKKNIARHRKQHCLTAERPKTA